MAEGRLVIGWLWRTQNINNSLTTKRITTKASNRAAVHGIKRPVTESVNKEEAEREMNKGKEEKEKKREEVEKTVDAQINDHKPYSPAH